MWGKGVYFLLLDALRMLSGVFGLAVEVAKTFKFGFGRSDHSKAPYILRAAAQEINLERSNKEQLFGRLFEFIKFG